MLATDLGKSSPGKARSRQLETYVHMCININGFLVDLSRKERNYHLAFLGIDPEKYRPTHQGAKGNPLNL